MKLTIGMENKRTQKTVMAHSMIRAINVEIPAPTTPNRGKPIKPKINKKFNKVLVTTAMLLANIGTVVLPISRKELA